MISLDIMEIANIWGYKLEYKHDVISLGQIYLLIFDASIFFFLLFFHLLDDQLDVCGLPDVINILELYSFDIIGRVIKVWIVILLRQLILLIEVLVFIHTYFGF